MIIDHVGIVVESLEAAAEYYVKTFGLHRVGLAVDDPRQEVHLQFLQDDRGQRLELISPSTPTSPVLRALKAGGGLNHVCYQVANLNESVESLVSAGAKVVREPTPAVAFDGRRVVFLFTKQRELVELVEAERH